MERLRVWLERHWRLALFLESALEMGLVLLALWLVHIVLQRL